MSIFFLSFFLFFSVLGWFLSGAVGFDDDAMVGKADNGCVTVAPATGTPETGGWSTRELRTILRGLEGINIIAADIVEVAVRFPYLPGAVLSWF